VREGTGWLCAEAHAPGWLSRSREAKYASDLAAGAGATRPSMRTCRSSTGQ